MSIETTARQLQSAFKLIGGVVNRRNAMPVLGCIKIDGNKLTGTNLDQTLSVPVAAAKADGKVCVEFHLLRRLLAHVPADDTVSIIAGSDGMAEVRFSSGRYDLPSLDADSFPDETWKPTGEYMSCEGLPDALRFVSASICTEETRYYLNGFCFSTDVDGSACVVTTDGRQMSVAPFASASWAQGMIIPRRVARLLAAMPAPLTLHNSHRPLVRFHFEGGVSLTTKIIEGTFPDWKRVLPKTDDATPSLTLDRSRFAAALRRVTTIIPDLGPFATLAFADNRAALVSGHEAYAREYLPGVASTNADDPNLVSFNAKKMQSLLASMPSDTVRLSVPSGGAPIRISAAGHKPWCLLMPMRSGDEKRALAALDEMVPADVARAA